MITKTIFPFSLALICFLIFNGVALAGEGSPQRDAQAVYGEIVAMGIGDFTVQNSEGEQIVYLVDDSTRFRSVTLEAPGFDDLQEESKVAIFTRQGDGTNLIARMVILLPDEFDPDQWASIRVRGEITNVDTVASSFSVQTQDGEETTFFADEHTRFLGQVSNLSDLQMGWKVAVGGTENDDGSFLAKLVGRAELENNDSKAGTISEVNLTQGTFSLSTRQDEDVNVTVDENTKFRSRDQQIQGLVDIEPNMVAVVIGEYQEDGSFLATQVAAGNEDDLPNFDVKIGGTVDTIAGDSLTIQSRSGEEITFLIDDETKFQGRGGVSSLEDLESGMTVLVGGFENEDGLPLAKLVFCWKE